MRKILAITGSTRENGNSEELMKVALENLDYEVVQLRKYIIKPIEDLRHSNIPFPNKDDDYYKIINKMLEANEIVFVTPIYWYCISGIMKTFIDRWTESLRSIEFDLKERMQNKKFYAIVVGANPDRTKAGPIVQQFEFMANYFKIPFGGAVVGVGDRPGDVLKDQEAVEKAKSLLTTK